MSQLKIITASFLWAALSSAYAQGTPPNVAFIDANEINLNGGNSKGRITVTSTFDKAHDQYTFNVKSSKFTIASFHVITTTVEQIIRGAGATTIWKFTPEGKVEVPAGSDLSWQAQSNQDISSAVGTNFYFTGKDLSGEEFTSKTLEERWQVKFDYIPGVPEPETYALMIVGLAVVAAQARKRTMH